MRNSHKGRSLAVVLIVMTLVVPMSLVWAQEPLRWTQSGGPPGGLVRAITFLPSPDRILIGTPNGIYVSHDKGETWSHIVQAMLQCHDVSVFATVVNAPDILYAGGAEGLFLSADGDATWKNISFGLPASYISSIAAHPTRAGLLYAAAGDSIYVSQNYGEGWSPIGDSLSRPSESSLNINAIAINPTSDQIIYAGTNAGLYHTVDGGEHWYAFTYPLPPEIQVMTIVVDPRDSARLHIGTPEGIYVSYSNGSDWIQMARPEGIEQPIVSAIALDPFDKQTLYANFGQSGVYATRDGGQSWTNLIQGQFSELVSTIAVHPQDAQRIYVGTGRGLLASEDGGATWHSANKGIIATDVRQMLDIPGTQGELYAATRWGVFRTPDGGETWIEASDGIRSPNIFVMAMDSGDARSVYASTWQNELYHSADAGQSWHPLTPPPAEGAQTTGLVVVRPPEAPDQPAIYAATHGRGVFVSRNNGESWTLLSNGLGQVAVSTILLVQHEGQQWIYVGTDNAIFHSRVSASDVGQSWKHVSLPALWRGRVTSLVHDLGTPGYMYVTTDLGGIYRGTYAGQDWNEVPSPGSKVDALAVVTRRGLSPLLAIATNSGIWTGDSSGSSWEANPIACQGRGAVHDMAVDDEGNGIVYVATSKGGIYRGCDQRPLFGPILRYASGTLLALVLAAAYFFIRSYSKKRRLAYQRQLIEDNWQEWNQAITDAFAINDRITPEMLTTIPIQARPLAIQRYLDTHRHLDLVLEMEPLAIEPANPQRLDRFVTQWSLLQEHLDDIDLAIPPASRLTEHVSELLGFALIQSRKFRSLFGYIVRAPAVRLSIPAFFPIIFVLKHAIQDEDMRDIRDMMSVMNVTSYFALLIVVDDTLVQRSRARELCRLVESGHDDFIVLDYADLRSLFLARDAENQLIKLILAQIDLNVVSPYVISGPVPENMFFGRDYELKAIMRTIRDRSFAIVGGRKIGKTSILRKVNRLIEETSGYASIHLDCQSVTTYQEFFASLAIKSGTQIDSTAPDELRHVVLRLRRQFGGSVLVLLLDEVDALLSYDIDRQFRLFHVFRALSQEGLCRFVFCGERKLDTELHNPKSPLFNFCNTIRLSYLTEQDARRMIQEPMSSMGILFESPDEILDSITALSSCHPNVVQNICRLLINRVNERGERTIRMQDLEAVRTGDEFRDFFIEVTWGEASTLEKLISILMSDREHFVQADVRLALRTHGCDVSSTEIETALGDLVLFSILQKQGNVYSYEAKAFPIILAESGFGPMFREAFIDEIVQERRAHPDRSSRPNSRGY